MVRWALLACVSVGISTAALADDQIVLPQNPGAAAPAGGPTPASQEVTAFSGSVPVDQYYQAKGIILGTPGSPFRLFPSLGLSVSHDDNVYRAPADPQSDWFATITPSLILDYDTERARLDLYAQSSIYEYSKLTTVDTTNFDFGAMGGYEVSREAQFKLGSSFSELSEPLSSPNVVGFQAKPTQYTDLNANGTFVYKPNRLGTTVGFSYDQNNFLNTPLIGGGSLGNKDRNDNIARGYIQTSYDFSPGYSGFVRFTYDDDHYDRNLDRAGEHRSSHGYQADTGVELLLTDLVSGQAYVGFVQADYDETQALPLRDISGLDFGANLTWYPTNLTTVKLAASRSFQDTTLAGAAAGDDRNVNLNAAYALTRQISLTVFGSYDDIAYKGTSPNRDDQMISVGPGAKWLINPYMSLNLSYTYMTRSSTVKGATFNDNLVTLGLNFQI